VADALRGALGLFEGAPLAGLPGSFAELERTRLDQLRATAIEDLAAAELDRPKRSRPGSPRRTSAGSRTASCGAGPS
jgi:hypothetical protein